ncbi:hypothetical protein MKJ04_10490 [Pontibacter sp. E15-1]|uniref:hypothetical protein n=1 Tax=Pontibacter sp. E15-1 TaxID=2919918 RepID=UPI001F4F2BD8|nr:hypothetical protein [Pontibacter sp. E15-1]MCJ8165271.1 hypothetical protein [Pontibacter sp. E15-1]
MKHLILSFCVLGLLISCNKKDLDEVEVAPAEIWELHNKFLNSQKFVSNIYADGNNLHVLGLSLFSIISQSGTTETVAHYYHDFEALAQNKFPLNAHVIVGKDRDGLYVRPVKNPTTFTTSAHLYMKALDPDFNRFALGLSYTQECIGLSDSNTLLIPYYSGNDSSFGTRLMLVKLSVSADVFGNDVVAVTDSKILNVGRSVFIKQIKSMGGNFYVESNFGLDKVSEKGEMDRIVSGEFVDGLFAHKGNYYAVTYHGSKGLSSLFTSNTGNNWVFVTNLNENVQYLSYYAVSDDLLLASYQSQLFEIDVNNSFNIRELDNTGLEGNFITGIAKTNDKVYVATQSGLFSKSIEQALTSKDIEK